MNSESLPPPIPPPSGDICANCGVEITSKNELCPHCGARLGQVFKRARFWSNAFDVILALWALGLGGLGSCALMVPAMLTSPSNSYLLGQSDRKLLVILGITSLVLAAGLFILLLRRARR